jgi:hypothetical protein
MTCCRSQPPHKSVKLSFTVTYIKNKLGDSVASLDAADFARRADILAGQQVYLKCFKVVLQKSTRCFKVVVQKSTPPQIRQLILHSYLYKEYVDGFVWE